jgi:hypothetical protein
VVNTSPKYIVRQNIRGQNINVFVQIIAAESDTFARRMPTPCYVHNLNTLQVSIYQNYAIIILLKAAAKEQKSVPTLWLGTHLLDGRFYTSLCQHMPCRLRRDNTILLHGSQMLLDSRWNVMTHGDAREGKVANGGCSQYYTTSEHGVSSITIADAHTSAASSRLNEAPTDLNGLVRFAERWSLVSARVPSHFKRSLKHNVSLDKSNTTESVKDSHVKQVVSASDCEEHRQVVSASDCEEHRQRETRSCADLKVGKKKDREKIENVIYKKY